MVNNRPRKRPSSALCVASDEAGATSEGGTAASSAAESEVASLASADEKTNVLPRKWWVYLGKWWFYLGRWRFTMEKWDLSWCGFDLGMQSKLRHSEQIQSSSVPWKGEKRICTGLQRGSFGFKTWNHIQSKPMVPRFGFGWATPLNLEVRNWGRGLLIGGFFQTIKRPNQGFSEMGMKGQSTVPESGQTSESRLSKTTSPSIGHRK